MLVGRLPYQCQQDRENTLGTVKEEYLRFGDHFNYLNYLMESFPVQQTQTLIVGKMLWNTVGTSLRNAS